MAIIQVCNVVRQNILNCRKYTYPRRSSYKGQGHTLARQGNTGIASYYTEPCNDNQEICWSLQEWQLCFQHVTQQVKVINYIIIQQKTQADENTYSRRCTDRTSRRRSRSWYSRRFRRSDDRDDHRACSCAPSLLHQPSYANLPTAYTVSQVKL